jgi:hypothetical protein
MMKRMAVLVSFGAGYVAGAAAGRERYEQIRGLVLRVKDDPRVQEKAHQAADVVREHAHDAAEKAKEHLPGTGGDDADAENAANAGAEPWPFHATTRY